MIAVRASLMPALISGLPLKVIDGGRQMDHKKLPESLGG
jgi:hypothetical protein